MTSTKISKAQREYLTRIMANVSNTCPTRSAAVLLRDGLIEERMLPRADGSEYMRHFVTDAGVAALAI